MKEGLFSLWRKAPVSILVSKNLHARNISTSEVQNDSTLAIFSRTAAYFVIPTIIGCFRT